MYFRPNLFGSLNLLDIVSNEFTHNTQYICTISNTRDVSYKNMKKKRGKMRLDPIDSQIITMLQNDGRRSFSEIADAVGRTEVTIRRRVKRLIDEGYIKRFTVVLDPLKIGRKIRAVIRVKTAMKEAAVISKKLREFQEVNEAYFLDGACGLMIMVTVDDLTELKAFLETRLGRIPGVGDAETCIVLEEIKSAF